VAFDGGGGLSVAGNDMTESCTMGEREREDGEAPSTMKQDRKGMRKAKLTGGGEDDGALA
jgi:hypothetical protein